MTRSYADGVAEGLRIAAEIARALEAAVEERLEQGSASVRTRDVRRTRAQAYRNAAGRIETRLRAHHRKPRRASTPGTPETITRGLSRLGL